MKGKEERRWVRVSAVSDLAPGTGRQVRVLGRLVAVFNTGTELVAVDGKCRHMNAGLAHGKLEGKEVVCRWHGWRYDLGSGRCLNKQWAVLRIYPVKVEGGEIFVDVAPIYEQSVASGRRGPAEVVEDE